VYLFTKVRANLTVLVLGFSAWILALDVLLPSLSIWRLAQCTKLQNFKTISKQIHVLNVLNNNRLMRDLNALEIQAHAVKKQGQLIQLAARNDSNCKTTKRISVTLTLMPNCLCRRKVWVGSGPRMSISILGTFCILVPNTGWGTLSLNGSFLFVGYSTSAHIMNNLSEAF
jgi:hypothetical protein